MVLKRDPNLTPVRPIEPIGNPLLGSTGLPHDSYGSVQPGGGGGEEYTMQPLPVHPPEGYGGEWKRLEGEGPPGSPTNPIPVDYDPSAGQPVDDGITVTPGEVTELGPVIWDDGTTGAYPGQEKYPGQPYTYDNQPYDPATTSTPPATPAPGFTPPPMPNPGSIWNPTGYGPDPMSFNTIPGMVGGTPDTPWYHGDQSFIDQYSSEPVGEYYNREVGANELVENRLSGLLASDSKFMQDARRQGLEQANAVGGLGGTTGIGASMQAALRSALPIAESDAQAYRAAAAQNLDAANQFAQLNIQRATQMDLAKLSTKAQMETSLINASISMATAHLQSATQRDLGMLDAETRLRTQEMQGQIQSRLADINYRYSALLNDQQGTIQAGLATIQGEYALAGTGLAGQYDLSGRQIAGEFGLAETGIQAEAAAAERALEAQRQHMARETSYITAVSQANSDYMNVLASIQAENPSQYATRAANAKAQFQATLRLLSSLYPDFPPITFDNLPGGR